MPKMWHLSTIKTYVVKWQRSIQTDYDIWTFYEMGFRFYGTYQPIAKNIGNQCIIITTNYTIKWVEAKAFKGNTTKNTVKFIYENIIIRFGCPTHFVNDQGSHFINKTIEVLVEELMIVHHKSTTYLQGNGYVKLTHKTLGLVTLVNVNCTNWDTMHFSVHNTMGILGNL